jgi:hypothetical protein
MARVKTFADMSVSDQVDAAVDAQESANEWLEANEIEVIAMSASSTSTAILISNNSYLTT